MRKNFMKVALAAIVGLCLTSCKNYFYQVYDVGFNDLKKQENSLVFENEDCKVLYNLWSNNGALRFAVLNKTDKDIFINMGQSFYVVNGQAVDYYQGRTFSVQSIEGASYMASSTVGTSGAAGFWGDGVYFENSQSVLASAIGKVSKSVSTKVTTKEMEIVCIPAKCFKVFDYYKINPAWIKTCDRQKDFPKKSYVVGTYKEYSTPLTVKNRIAYGFTKNDVADKHIDNAFWISAVTNYSQKEATEKYKKTSECYGRKSSSKGKMFKIGGPDKFYQKYERK